MPIRVPTIQRNAPQDTPSVGRVEFKPSNVLAGQQAVDKSIEGLATQGIDMFKQYEEHTAVTAAKAASIEYHQYLESRLEGDVSKGIIGIKYLRGDPTEAYRQFDIDSKEKYNEILGKHSDASLMTRSKVDEHLKAADAKFYDRKTIDYGRQLDQYSSDVTKANSKIILKNLTDNLVLYNKNTPDFSKKLVDNHLAAIAANQIDHGLGNESVKKDKSGAIVNVEGFVNVKIAEEQSDALLLSLRTMAVAPGGIDNAKHFHKLYGSKIDKKHSSEIDKLLETETKNQQAEEITASIMNRSIDEQNKVIDSIKNPSVRTKVVDNLHSFMVKRRASKEQQQEDNYNVVIKGLMEKQRSGNLPLTINELENDPSFKRVKYNLSNKGLQAIYDVIENPKKSNPEALAEMYEAATNGSFKGMSIEKFNILQSRLSGVDRKKYDNLYFKYNTPTEAEEAKTWSTMNISLEKKLLGEGLIRKNDGGFYYPNQQKLLNQYRDEFTEELKGQTLNLSNVEKNDLINKFILAKKKGEAFKVTPTKGVFSTPPTTQGTVTAPTTQDPRLIFSLKDSNGNLIPEAVEATKRLTKQKVPVTKENIRTEILKMREEGRN